MKNLALLGNSGAGGNVRGKKAILDPVTTTILEQKLDGLLVVSL